MKKLISLLTIITMVACCFSVTAARNVVEAKSKTNKTVSAAMTLNKATWNYDQTNDVYYQIKLQYCDTPAAADYETLGIYVPGKYFDGTVNADGTYTCKVNTKNKVNGFTGKTAPIVYPVNTGGYAAQAAPTSYSYDSISSYLQAGFIYVYAGLRGKSNGTDDAGNLIYSGGAPWGVTDLKAAIRYYRYNSSTLPGNKSNIFTFGHSGGGAQSALAGATGDSKLYKSYLNKIGAAMTDKNGKTISDAVAGAMCWCPITNLDYADEAYEWNMGQYSTSDTRADGTFTKALSNDLATAYAKYVNKLGLKDADGNTLTLKKSSTGIYTSGSYYKYLMKVVQKSLNNFLKDTTFPYTPSNSFSVDGGFGGSGNTASGGMPSGGLSGGRMMGGSSTTTVDTNTYNTVEDYIASLNSDTTWIKYNSKKNTATITSMSAFVTHCKNATKSVGAFDSLDRSQAENDLFGNDANESLHFDACMAALLKKNQSSYAGYSDFSAAYVTDYANDLKQKDSLGNTIQTRLNMYNPMYYLNKYYKGNGTSKVAKYWRIRTGIDQGDTALTTETNLALALKQNKDVKSVDFATVWGMGHTTAERTGTSSNNFISWVEDCVK